METSSPFGHHLDSHYFNFDEEILKYILAIAHNGAIDNFFKLIKCAFYEIKEI